MWGKSHKKKKSIFYKLKVGLGLIFGAFLGQLFAPKKGRDIRKYMQSEQFKNKLTSTGKKAKTLVNKLRCHCARRIGRMGKMIKKTRSRFGK